jgi:hypothetical protein
MYLYTEYQWNAEGIPAQSIHIYTRGMLRDLSPDRQALVIQSLKTQSRMSRTLSPVYVHVQPARSSARITDGRYIQLEFRS